MSDKAGRVVFIGNIPYGLTEEQIIQLCNTVGQVLSFRLVYDQDTGRPKGFGFAEFADKDAAESAVRNLDKYSMGGRELRVDFSHVGGKDESNNQQQRTNPEVAAPPPQGLNGVGPLPPGSELPAGLTCHDAISKTLSTLPPPQLLDILSQMKGLVTGDPAKATELLRQAPQLSYAIFQALLLMGLVDSGHIASVVNESQQQAPPPQPTPSQMPARPVANAYGGYAPTPPIGGQPFAPPPQSTPQQQQQQLPPPQMPPGQEELLKQVLNMPQHEVDRLPPNERAQIMALKQQFGGMRY